MSRKVDWYARGRDAYDAGKPNICTEGRISGKDRDSWYNGWHAQQRFRTNPAAQADVKAAIEGVQAIRDLLNSQP